MTWDVFARVGAAASLWCISLVVKVHLIVALQSTRSPYGRTQLLDAGCVT
jgi:hypothetical protein